jgi:hypothetical protein
MEGSIRSEARIPELRLRPDASVEVLAQTSAHELLEELAKGEARSIYLHGEAGQGVLVPLERYIALVGASLASSNRYEADLEGRLTPADLASADVETIDPHATWRDTA